MSNKPAINIQQIIFDSLALTADGVGLFDEKDVLIYCNEGFGKLFALSVDQALHKTFTQLVTHCFNSPNGLNVETNDLDLWFKNAAAQRRSRPFRSFETDTQDGHWYLVTEQIVHENYLYIYSTDITEKKNTENALRLLSEEMHKLASTDFLTGIYNRRYFYELAEKEFSRCTRNGKSLSILVLDVDNFKIINDKYGHAAGDVALQHFTTHIKKLSRKYDVFGRIGGEEFAVLLPMTDLPEAVVIAERIRAVIEMMTIPYEGQLLSITTSIGMAVKHNGQHSIDDVIRVADNNLYQAKLGGRNQVC